MASFQAKAGRDRLRVIPKKKVIVPIHFNPIRNWEFQKNSKKIQKIKEYHYGFFSSQNGIGPAESDTKKKKKLSFESIPTRLGIGNDKKIAKKCKKLKKIILASFQAKTGRDKLRVIPKKKVIVLIHSNPTKNREFQKK